MPIKSKHPNDSPQRERFIVLVLQGGGALGAYHLGAVQALDEAGYVPDWITGVSIGSVNGAILAGNPPATRVQRLQQFWERVTDPPLWDVIAHMWNPFIPGNLRRLASLGNAMQSLIFGQPHFSRPNLINPYLARPGTAAATSFFDNSPLRRTLEDFVDLDYLNNDQPRLSLGVTLVRTGDVLYFDTDNPNHRPFTLDHVIASTAIPPLFAGVRINGDLYWDGGIVDNTPLDPVLDEQDAHPERSTLVFMIDLWGQSERDPETLDEVLWRTNQIEFASRTDRQIKTMLEKQNLQRTLHDLVEQAPPAVLSRINTLDEATNYTYGNLDIVRVIYRPDESQSALSYMDFSHSSITRRIADGYADMRAALDKSPWLVPPSRAAGVSPRATLHAVERGQIRTEVPEV